MNIRIDHLLYKTGDTDCPPQILDRNGEVVLGLCRFCGEAEGDLSAWCPSRSTLTIRDCRWDMSPAYKAALNLHKLAGNELSDAERGKYLAGQRFQKAVADYKKSCDVLKKATGHD